MTTAPLLLSVNVVEQLPLDKVELEGWKRPLLLVLHVTMPVGFDPDIVTVQVMGVPLTVELIEQTTNAEDCVRGSQGCMSG
jgi:hypothetical protein